MALRTISVAARLQIAGFMASLKTMSAGVGKFNRDLLDGAKKNQGSLDKLSQGSMIFGGVMLAGVGLAVKAFADYDAAMSKVRAATHGNTQTMAELGDAAMDAGKRTAFSATEAAGGIEALAKAGVTTKDILGGGLNGALDLAAAGELEVADAAETAASAMTQFKLKGSDVPHIADLLAAGAGKAQGEVSDMARALNQSGLVAGQMGLTIEETTGTLASFASAGLLGSDAGTSFRTMLLRLANPTEEVKVLFEELGINVYNASGQFVGMAPLAGQLQTKLGALTDEQRNAALATIFGSDAIRAASILYSQGAKGIQEWTDKVNDQGFAADTAAIKTDNLKGDIERFMGSLETAFIDAGSGANGFAREVVQSLTGVVDMLNDMSPAAKTALLAIAGIVGLGALVTGVGIKIVTALSSMRAAYIALGTAAKGVTIAAGAVGLALAAGVFILGAYAQKQADARQAAEELGRTLNQQTGAIQARSREWAFTQLKDAKLIDQADRLGLSLRDLTDAMLGNGPALKKINAELDRLYAAEELSIQGTEGVDASMTKTGKAINGFRDQINDSNGALRTSRKELKQQKEAGVETKDATEDLAGATDVAKQATKDLGKEVSDAAEELKGMEDRAKGLRDELELLAGVHRDSIRTELDFREALAEAGGALDEVKEKLVSEAKARGLGEEAAKAWAAAQIKSIKHTNEQKGAFDRNSESGKILERSLLDIADAAGEHATQLFKETGDQAKATGALNAGRTALINAAIQYGLTKRQAQRYADEIMGTPKAWATTFSQPGLEKGVTKTRDYNEGIKAIASGKKVTWSSPGLERAVAKATELDNKSRSLDGRIVRTRWEERRVLYLETVHNKGGKGRAPGERVLKAAGGWINGPGTGTSDDVPMWASNGEFYVRAARAREFGPLLEAINNGAMSPGDLMRGFAREQGDPGQWRQSRPRQTFAPPQSDERGGAGKSVQFHNYITTAERPTTQLVSELTRHQAFYAQVG